MVPATQRPNRPLTPPQSEVVVATADGSSSQADLTLDTIHFSSSPGFQEIDLVGSEARSERPSSSVSNHTTSLLQGGQQGPSPSANSATSRPGLITGSQRGDIDTGFLHVYGPENEFDAQKQALEACLNQEYPLADPQQHGLMGSFSETYFEYCYPWCPVLDPSTIDAEIARSPLLANALAVAGSHVQPPLMPCPGPAEYYKKAKTIFYEDGEMDELTTLKSIALFYWWAPRPPSLVHRHSSWWWTSVSIRHAQQMNLHREPSVDDPLREQLSLSLRRKIWWTSFVSFQSNCKKLLCPMSCSKMTDLLDDFKARERLTALCQSKPVIIDPEDCSVSELVLEDFPIEPRLQRKGEVFIYWVRLCAIIGKVAKTLFRPAKNASSDFQSLDQHRKELVDWVTSLPPHLRLSINSARTQHFDRDVHQLHLPYLTTIIVLNLRRSAESLPQALPPAILAASCTSRILRDILARGNARFLQAISCWYCGTAFIPLLQASWVPSLSKDANASLDILERTVEQLQKMWATADVIQGGFRRLRSMAPESSWSGPPPLQPIDHAATGPNHENSLVSEGVEGFDWTTLFPFATRQTSDIADILLKDNEEGMFNDVFPSDSTMFHEALMTQFDDPFAGGPDLRMEFMAMPP